MLMIVCSESQDISLVTVYTNHKPFFKLFKCACPFVCPCVCVCVCVCSVPYDHAPAVCGRHLQPVELHELPAVAVHRCGGAGFNLPPIYKT